MEARFSLHYSPKISENTLGWHHACSYSLDIQLHFKLNSFNTHILVPNNRKKDIKKYLIVHEKLRTFKYFQNDDRSNSLTDPRSRRAGDLKGYWLHIGLGVEKRGKSKHWAFQV